MRPVLILLLTLLATPALASDGVLEINQTCAVETGCFSGDDPGFPVTISATGSYQLTSNLNHGGDDDGIFLRTGRLTIDFNGFSLIGSAFGGGTGNGIAGGGTNGDVAPYTTIKNGIIRLSRGRGIDLGGAFGLHIEDMTVENSFSGGIRVGDGAKVLKNTFRFNGTGASPAGQGLVAGASSLIDGNIVIGSGAQGIFPGPGSTVSGNTVYSNGGGIQTGSGTTVSGNTVHENVLAGIVTGGGSTVAGNTVHQNGGVGIRAQTGSTVSSNTAYKNGGGGIEGFSGVTIIGNTSYENGDTTSSALDHGIECGFGCIVRGNSVRLNTGLGLDLGTDSGYSDNVVTDNATGTVTGGVNAGGNLCNGSLTCP